MDASKSENNRNNHQEKKETRLDHLKEWFRPRLESLKEESLKIKFWLEAGAIATGFLYATIALFQLCATLNILHADQRAWVIPKTGAIQLVPNQPISWPMQFGVSGKTPAKMIDGVFKMEVVNANDTPSFEYPPAGNAARIGAKAQVMFPNFYTPPGMTASIKNQTNGANSFEDQIYTETLRSKYRSREIVFVLYGLITYDDIYNVTHTLKFCSYDMYIPPSGDIGMPPPATDKCYRYAYAD
jgi:hypothetical protein